MSELSLVVPLSALPAGTQLTTEGIVATLSDAQEARNQTEQYRQQHNAMAAQLRTVGGNLTRILDEVEDPWHRAHALRNLASELTRAARPLDLP